MLVQCAKAEKPFFIFWKNKDLFICARKDFRCTRPQLDLDIYLLVQAMNGTTTYWISQKYGRLAPDIIFSIFHLWNWWWESEIIVYRAKKNKTFFFHFNCITCDHSFFMQLCVQQFHDIFYNTNDFCLEQVSWV